MADTNYIVAADIDNWPVTYTTAQKTAVMQLWQRQCRKINAVVDFSFANDLVKDRYTPDFGRPAEDPEFMLRLCSNAQRL